MTDLTKRQLEVLRGETAEWRERPMPDVDRPARLSRVDRDLYDMDLLDFSADPDSPCDVRTGPSYHGRERLRTRLTAKGVAALEAADVPALFNMTPARSLILRSAKHYPPSAWVVSDTGDRTGLECVSWRRNCRALAEAGYLSRSAHGDWYLTDRGMTFVGVREDNR